MDVLSRSGERQYTNVRLTPVTLILGVYVKWHALQVSDRLVTLRVAPPGPFEPWDVLANKNVVYFGRRGVVSIAGAGLAYLNGRTTDQWLAEKLSGVDLATPAALVMGHAISHPFDVGQAIEHLRQQATATYTRARPSLRREITEFQIVGSQWGRKGRLRPVICTVTNRRTRTAQFEKLATPRYWDIQNGWYSIGSGTGQQEARRYLRERARADGGLISPEHCLDLMVEAVRHTATIYPDVVGQDCMCVHIQSGSPRAAITFHPKEAYQLVTATGSTIGPIAFTPFVVARDMVAMPSISANKMFFTTPGVDIQFGESGLVPLDQGGAWQQYLPRPSAPS